MSYEKDEFAMMDITIEMDMNQIVIARDGYTFFDFLSDIGGMQGMLVSLVVLVLNIWNYNYFDNYMVSRLFKIKRADAEEKDLKGWWQSSAFIKPGPCDNLKAYFCDMIPRCFRSRCCQPGRKESAFM